MELLILCVVCVCVCVCVYVCMCVCLCVSVCVCVGCAFSQQYVDLHTPKFLLELKCNENSTIPEHIVSKNQ